MDEIKLSLKKEIEKQAKIIEEDILYNKENGCEGRRHGQERLYKEWKK